MADSSAEAILIAGIPADNATLFYRLGLAVGDPAAWLSIDGETTALLRDIEKDRAQELGLADHYACPADFAPPEGLDADRATATAQAVAECLRRVGAVRVRTDRSLPFVFAWHVMQRGISLDYDAELGVLERRVKTLEQQEAMGRSQKITEQAIQLACSMIARSQARTDGVLYHDGALLTSERVKSEIARYLLDYGFSMGHGAIVATAPDTADCHHGGAGPLRTGVPVIVDIFPRDESSRYWGDCTRTVVHGTPTPAVLAMHQAVLAAKAASIDRLRSGSTASSVHLAAIDVLQQHGFRQSRGKVTPDPTIQHGTGHGIGLEVHEPVLLDEGGGALLEGEVLTVEPGLYGRRDGGVRVEDMVVVTKTGSRNLNHLQEGLDWS